MQQSRHPKYEKSKDSGALRQGEILFNVVQVSLYPDTLDTGAPRIERSTHRYAIVVTPDCDLDWDFKAQHGIANQAKIVPNIVLCAVMFSSDLAKLINDDMKPGKKFETRTPWKRTTQNREERYHFLEKIDGTLDLQGKGTRSLGIDFKRFFTIPTKILYASIDNGLTFRMCRLVQPYSDHLNSRFAYFQSRIGLPEDHQYIKGEIYLGGDDSPALTL